MREIQIEIPLKSKSAGNSNWNSPIICLQENIYHQCDWVLNKCLFNQEKLRIQIWLMRLFFDLQTLCCTFVRKRDLIKAGGPPQFHGQFCPPSNKNPENPIFQRDNTQSPFKVQTWKVWQQKIKINDYIWSSVHSSSACVIH